MQPEPVDELRTAKLNPATATDFEAMEKQRLKTSTRPFGTIVYCPSSLTKAAAHAKSSCIHCSFVQGLRYPAWCAKARRS